MRRVPRVPALTLAAMLMATGCGGSSGGAPVAAPGIGPGRRPCPDPCRRRRQGQAAASGLATLVVTPTGFDSPPARTNREKSGSFDIRAFVEDYSAAPHEDRALLMNADFTDGYYAFSASPDRQTQVTLYLFQAGTSAKAATLEQGLWAEGNHGIQFAVPGVPGAKSGAKVMVAATTGRTIATADVSFVVGKVVARIGVRHQFADDARQPVPDTGLAADLARQQHLRLAAGAQAPQASAGASSRSSGAAGSGREQLLDQRLGLGGQHQAEVQDEIAEGLHHVLGSRYAAAPMLRDQQVAPQDL